MTVTKEEEALIRQATEDLFNYAIDREEVKWLMERLHQESEINRTAVEYELGVMKIVAIGWAISFHLEGSPCKKNLLTGFWNRIFEFSNGLSETAGTMTGTRIDYFQVLKERLDQYVNAIATSHGAKTANEPAAVIGPKFAAICGNSEDIYTRMTGVRMFMTNVSRVGQYLKGAGFAEQGRTEKNDRGSGPEKWQ